MISWMIVMSNKSPVPSLGEPSVLIVNS
jgi:hypothetical protein